ncbi:hypothetical protein DMB65_04005 [Flavobacterium cheongpyeongense]|uniref:Gliding motility protein GldL n=2 Tax=Flavobacterium TaxID=237 RepID=A0A2V4BTT8_9FLAO|nr:hypothetical protein [Flavobacterium cheongpyeongense]PXY42401.1 hypothetical protein DMB65_04005 [Flavobacterium cheongpyeongense]
MSTLVMNQTKYGVTESKKRTLDSLTIQVLNATDEVSQLQAIVTSLTNKLNTYQGFLTQADANKTQAKNNVVLMDGVIKNALNLKDSSKVALNEIVHANDKTKEVAQNTTIVINKLIYTAEMINKLAGLITRKKAQNPLISDQLIALITKAGTNANNAVALTLVALNATFTAQSTNKDVLNTAALENVQSRRLYDKLTSDNKTNSPNASLKTLLNNAYQSSVAEFNKMQNAYNETLNQLNLKTAELNKAQINLKSLQAGLAAANAAALAS